MRKGLCLLLTLCLCITTALPVLADQANSEVVEKLILSAKEKFSISDDEFVFSDYYQIESERGNRYSLNWESKDELQSSNINVEMSETGSVIQYQLYDDLKKYNKLKYPEKTEAEALDAAKKYFAVIDSEKAEQVAEGKISYDSYSHCYSYIAERMLGSLPVFGESLSVQLDADTLRPNYYYADWTENLTAPEENYVSSEEAIKTYREKLGYELFYQVVSQDNQDSVKLVYRPKYDETLYIDAENGEVITFAEVNDGNSGGGSRANAEKSAMMDAAQLSEEERAMIAEISKMLSKEKAEQIARGVPEFKITKDYTAEDYYISKNVHGKYIGRISFRMDDEKNKTYGYRHVSIDVKTGEVVGYSGFYNIFHDNAKSGAVTKKKEMTTEQSQKAAEDFLKKYYPQKFKKMTIKDVFEPQASRVSYQREENNVKVYNNGVNICLDTETGDIREFSLEWTDAEFPQVSAADMEKVYEKILTEDNFRCGYLVSYNDEKKAAFVKAVYQTENNPVLDAESLQKLNWRLRPVEEQEKPEYTDIAGHYAEETVKKLSFMGIYYPGTLLRPNDAVTQKEYLKLLSQVLYQRSWGDDDDLYQSMISNGVLTKDEIHPEASVTRIDGIRYLLNAMGYREFANIRGIFLCPFADVAEADKGYGAIAAGLGLVNSQSDTFYADSALRRGDSLIIIYNYLSR